MRVPGSRTQRVLWGAVFVAIVATFMGLLAVWRYLGSTDVVGDPGRSVHLADVSYQDFGRELDFTLPVNGSGEQNLSLLAMRASSLTVDRDGVEIASIKHEDGYRPVRVVNLGSSSGPENKVSLSVSGEGLFLSYALFGGMTRDIELFLSVYDALQTACIAIMATMLIYALSLFFYKRNEKYLLVFSVYLAVVCLMYLVRTFYVPGGSGIAYPFVITAITAFKYCMVAYSTYLLVVGRAFGIRANAAVLAAIVLVSAGRGLACSTSMSFLVSESTRIALVAVCAAVLVYARSLRVPGTMPLLVGYAVFVAAELDASMNPVESCLQIGLCNYTALFELPFAFTCMFLINRRFAENYRKSEALSRELSELNRDLDQMVEQRTAEALVQRDQRHNLMLNVFHDLRSPLFVLKGCTDILKASAERHTSEQAEIIDTMAERVGFVSTLTEDLFTLAKLEGGDLQVSMSRTSLTDVVRDTVRAEAVRAKNKGVELSSNLAEGCAVWGSRSLLTQIVQNLIVNAIVYTPANGSVHISLLAEDSRCVVRVSDSGPGIAPEDLERIFERYYRAGSGSSHGSTGLGLSIAKALTELHKGTVEVSSKLGEGTTFTLTLPRID